MDVMYVAGAGCAGATPEQTLLNGTTQTARNEKHQQQTLEIPALLPNNKPETLRNSLSSSVYLARPEIVSMSQDLLKGYRI
jgi:hypothetical protein